MQAIHSLFMMDSFTAARLPRLAMLTCVRNEAKWLPAFLEYHHAIGVERAYVYCDRCTDGSEAIARSYPWVQVFRIDAEQVARFSYISDIHCACMSHSLALARQEGFDWLMILDADEFACGNNPGATALDRALLLPMLIDAKPETVQIRLLTREVVPMRVPAGTPFWQQRYFQSSPRRAWNIVDPRDDQHHRWTDFLGHRQGKSIVRTCANVQGYDSHRWVPNQKITWPQRPEYVELPTEESGYHRHFYITSQSHWLDKFRKQNFEPNVWICGKDVELPKRSWRQLIAQMSSDQIDGYFDRWIARSEEELRSFAHEGLVEQDTDLLEILQIIGVATAPPTFFPLEIPQRNRAAGTVVGGSVAEIPPAQRIGFYGLERSGLDYFRWTETHASIQMRVPHGDYRLRLDMKHLGAHWAGRLDVRLNDRPITCRDRTLTDELLSQTLLKEDLPNADEFWLHLEFDPVDTKTWGEEVRQLGAPIFAVYLDSLSG